MNTENELAEAKPDESDLFWTPKEMAIAGKFSEAWLERDRASGEPVIPYIKLGRLVRYIPKKSLAAMYARSVGDAK